MIIGTCHPGRSGPDRKSPPASAAISSFGNTQVNITTEGKPHLGAALGTQTYIDQYVAHKVQLWSSELKRLSSIATSQPHAAYAAFTHGMASKWCYIARTIPNISHLLQPLEDIITSNLIPALTGKAPPNDLECNLFALPSRLGGIGLVNPTKLSESEYPASKLVTKPLCDLIFEQNPMYSFETAEEQHAAKAEIRKTKRQQSSHEASHLKSILPDSLQHAVELAQEKGASSWLTALPVEEFGFALHKGAFHDALALRYGWSPYRAPIHCDCGDPFSMNHALSYPKGGFPSIRHNEICDLTANLLSEVCHSVSTEPHLQPISGETLTGASANVEDGARLDILANGFWGSRFERAFFDVRVFNPHAPSNRQPQLATSYRRHENLKKRCYEQRIREVEHGSFTPLVLSATGGLGRAATVTYRRLASLLSTKLDQPYSTIMGWLRCRLSFSLLCSSILCIRGARSSLGHATTSVSLPVDLVTSESQVTHQN